MSWLTALVDPAIAQVPIADDVATFTGDLRYIGSDLSDFPVDAEGTMLGQSAWLDQRLRVGATIAPKANGGDQPWRFRTEWDLGTGQLAGDTWAIDGDVDARHRETHSAFTLAGIRPRALAVTGGSGDLQLEAGLVTSNWGLGMVANDGAHEPLFGRADFGDRVVRIRATEVPDVYRETGRGVLITAAADVVVEDDTSSVADGQVAFQAIGSALAIDGNRKFGTYLVLRHQIEADRVRSTQAAVLDVFATAPHPLGEWGRIEAGAEVAGILGRTDRATTYAAQRTVGVESLGAVAQVALVPASERMRAELRAGYASGDGNPDDGVSHDFAFDRDYGVGMVLFDEVMGGIEAATHALLSDPRYAGQAPDGAEAIVTEGAFRRATFLQPVVSVRPLAAGPHAWGVDLRVGGTFAFATAPVAQPFYTYRSGGTPYNAYDVPAEGRYLGTELDWAAGFTTRPLGSGDGSLRFALELEGGHLVLGKPLRSDDGPGTVNLVTATGRVAW